MGRFASSGSCSVVFYLCVFSVSVLTCIYLFFQFILVGETDINSYLYTCLSKESSAILWYDVEPLIMDVSSSWKCGKPLIYTHRFPGIFIGLAKCHYTAGGEVMDCNKLWCGWVCVSSHWLINRNTLTSLKRSTILPPPVIFSNRYGAYDGVQEQKVDWSTHTHTRPTVFLHRLTYTHRLDIGQGYGWEKDCCIS